MQEHGRLRSCEQLGDKLQELTLRAQQGPDHTEAARAQWTVRGHFRADAESDL
jgi:hypothetical protein